MSKKELHSLPRRRSGPSAPATSATLPPARWCPLTRVSELDGYSWATERLLRTWLYGSVGLDVAKVGGVILVDLVALDGKIEAARRGSVVNA